MPPIKREMYAKSETYMALNKRSDELKEENDCAVKTLAVVAGISYDAARDMLAAKGRKARRGTIRIDLYDSVKELGFTSERISPQDFIKLYPSPHCKVLKSVTTHHMDRFPAAWRDGHTYIVHTKGHVLAVVDGKNHDWTRGSAKRVWKIERITKKETL